MQKDNEGLMRFVFNKWRKDGPEAKDSHPDEEALSCLLEDKLPKQERDTVLEHLLHCNSCLENFSISFNLAGRDKELLELPKGLLERVRELMISRPKIDILEVSLRLKDAFWELLHATGDILLEQELVPAPILRSRSIKDFKDEITILKDFQDIRVEVKIESQPKSTFRLTVKIREKQTQKILKNLRITLLKGDIELESYLTDLGQVVFEHVLLGSYTVEISTVHAKLASVLLDIKN